MNPEQLLVHFDRVSEAPDAIPRLRRFILGLAVRGKLAPQDPNDEPASELLKRIEAEKRRKVRDGEVRKVKSIAPINGENMPHPLPETWLWVRLGEIFDYDAGTKTEPKQLPKDAWLLELEDIEKDTGKIVNMFTVDERLPKSTKSGFQSGDVLYGKLRPYLNKSVVANSHGFSTTEIVALRCYGESAPHFTCLALRRPDFVDYVTRFGQGTKMPRIRTEDAISALFPLPPLAEQPRIVAKVDELMRLCDQMEAAREEREQRRDRLAAASLSRIGKPTEDESAFRGHARFHLANLSKFTSRPDQIPVLRKTILDLAVRGQLVPQDPNDEPASELLNQIEIERSRLVKVGEIRRWKPLPPIDPTNPPYEIHKSWKWKKIGEIALFTDYGTSHASNRSSSGVPVLTMGNIQSGGVRLGGGKTVPSTIDDLPSLYLRKFDLLYNRTNSADLVGKTGIYLGRNNDYTFASYLIRIRLSLESTNPHYINLAMNAPFFRKTQIEPHLKQQCGQANVNGTILKNMLIPLPPLAEQNRIVTKVGELMALCDQLEVQLTSVQTGSLRLLETLLHQALEPELEEVSA